MSKIFFRVYKDAISSGLMRELGKGRWMLLCVLASYMDKDGRCYPTQEQLARDMGLSRQSVNVLVQRLKEFTWNGKPIITVEKHGNGFNNNNEYRIWPNSQLAIFESDNGMVSNELDKRMSNEHDNRKLIRLDNLVSSKPDTNYNQYNNNQITIKEAAKPQLPLFKNGKDVAVYFYSKYREKYTVNYSGNFSRDASLGKKLLADFKPEQVKDIIDVVFIEFETRWKKDRYPRPTLGAIVSWQANEALALIEKNKAQCAKLDAARNFKPLSVEEKLARLNRKKV